MAGADGYRRAHPTCAADAAGLFRQINGALMLPVPGILQRPQSAHDSTAAFPELRVRKQHESPGCMWHGSRKQRQLSCSRDFVRWSCRQVRQGSTLWLAVISMRRQTSWR